MMDDPQVRSRNNDIRCAFVSDAPGGLFFFFNRDILYKKKIFLFGDE